MNFESWGRYPHATQTPIPAFWPHEALPEIPSGTSLLPYGQGRSYGDSCLNHGNSILLTRYLDRFIQFDPVRGILRCEAGVTIEKILDTCLPRGWFIPVSPGTKFVSVGGAIANDIHGKNHHRVGTFGCFVRRFELLRSSGERIVCTPSENSDWFAATIGGLGLTGLITWAEIQLKPVPGPRIDQESCGFRDLNEFFALSRESENGFEYSVAWIDCLASGRNLGRGIFIRGNHAPPVRGPAGATRHKVSVPFNAPSITLNPFSVRLFNLVYYWKHARRKRAIVHYDTFFYPLDAVHHWNRIYGRRGFLQYQCVVPIDNGDAAIRAILARIARFGSGSFLAVLKTFGSIRSPGLLSFPRPGVTLALDFPMTGPPLFAMLDELDKVVLQSGGAVYPAKDCRMNGQLFQAAYPRHLEFRRFLDPAFSSSFWRRVE